MDPQKRNAPIAKSHGSAANITVDQHTIKPFQGTRNVNELRALDAFIKAQGEPISRKDLDRLCGAANSPEIVRRLREKGLPIKCDMQETVNRFGESVKAGYYSLTPYAAMPDDKPEQPAAYRHLVCIAHVKADELQEWLDGVASRVAGGTHG